MPQPASLMTPLGVISGEALAYIEQHRRITLRQLARALPWPSALVTMGVGALVRGGLIQAMQYGFEIFLEPVGGAEHA